jgi:hypothetical protein
MGGVIAKEQQTRQPLDGDESKEKRTQYIQHGT